MIGLRRFDFVQTAIRGVSEIKKVDFYFGIIAIEIQFRPFSSIVVVFQGLRDNEILKNRSCKKARAKLFLGADPQKIAQKPSVIEVEFWRFC